MADFSNGIRFSDSCDFVRVGDIVVIDCRRGVVQEVCLPHTEHAQDCSCWESGGLLILFDDRMLELRPFNFIETIHRADSGDAEQCAADLPPPKT